MKKKPARPILIISSTIVMPFLLARLSKNLRVMGGCAQYCIANKNIVTRAGVDNTSVLAAIVEDAPPMIPIGFLRNSLGE